MKKILCGIVLVASMFAMIMFSACGSSSGAVVQTICSTADQICTYKTALCQLASPAGGTAKSGSAINSSTAVSLESFYRSKLVELAESLKVQAQPLKQ